MRVLLRADASRAQGTGHVMRCLTLAEVLLSRGHDVELMASIHDVPWLAELVSDFAIELHACTPESLVAADIVSLHPDWVVIDSYRIEAEAISQLNESVPCLAIIDGDDRGIVAALYLDQNLGSEMQPWPPYVRERLLAGSTFTLTRDAFISRRRKSTPVMPSTPNIIAFMGGSDPLGAIVDVSRSVLQSGNALSLTAVSAPQHSSALDQLATLDRRLKVVSLTRDLPQLLAKADVAVSAAGTSAWDLCTIGVPSVLVAIVPNQQESLAQAVQHGVAVGVDAVNAPDDAFVSVGENVTRLIENNDMRIALVTRSLELFDGQGGRRVAERMEVAG